MNTLIKQNYKVVKIDCLEWLKIYNKPIKFCHIDASHDYESVYRTIRLLLPNVVRGSILCGDDFIYSDSPSLHGGVKRAVSELLPNFKSNGNLWYWFND